MMLLLLSKMENIYIFYLKKYDGKEFIIFKNNNKMLIKKLKQNGKTRKIDENKITELCYFWRV